MSLLDTLLIIVYIIIFIFIMILLYYVFKFFRWIYHKIDRFAHPNKKFLNTKKLMGDLTVKYGKSKAKKIFYEIKDELRKTGIK